MGRPTFDFAQVGVLIVDDNRHMRSLLCSIMHALGMKRLREVADGESALRIIDDFKPEIVITDWHMEPMDGLELVRKIRHAADETTRYVPIIMLTGHADAWRVKEARDAGVHEFLAKPISAKSLFARIVAVVDSPRPFIKATDYFGPDRRRQDIGPPAGEQERRREGRTAVVGAEAAPLPAGNAARLAAS
ncbi:MAG: response regulator [Rhodospirillaceae bacterium]